MPSNAAVNDRRASLSVSKQQETNGHFEYDVREDEDQLLKFQEIVDLLVASGYFPARIDSLTPFDKIVGGMIWCIEYCDIYIDTDLLFQDNTPTIGQKISLTEKVIVALQDMQCPYSIEPHQIQGFDFIHIFPVVQWLIATYLVYGKEMASHLKSYAFKEFKKQFQPNDIKSLIQTQRRVLNQLNVIQKSNQLIPKPSSITEQNDLLDNDLKDLLDEKKNLEKSVAIIEVELNKLRNKNDHAKEDLSTILKNLDANQTESEQIENLVKDHEKYQNEERIFKEKCKKRINEIKLQIQQEELKRHPEIPKQIEEETNMIQKLKSDLNKVTRMTSVFLRRIDRVPDQAELMQYQQRLLELYNQVAVRHKELKQYFNLFNTLEDTKVYMKKEISILTSVLDNYPKAAHNDHTGTEYVDQLENIAKKIKESRQKYDNNLCDVEMKKEDLSQKLEDLLNLRRQFIQTINQLGQNFQERQEMFSC